MSEALKNELDMTVRIIPLLTHACSLKKVEMGGITRSERLGTLLLNKGGSRERFVEKINGIFSLLFSLPVVTKSPYTCVITRV